MMQGMDDGIEVRDKPAEFLAVYGTTAELFDTLRRWFRVPTTITLNLATVDSAVAELGDPMLIAAMAMRKLQALNLLATPGVRTTTDVIITIVQDLERALVQAPSMRLSVAAAATDWDSAFEQLTSDGAGGANAPSTDDEDLEAARFRSLHAQLHDAVRAVIDASDGEIRYFV
jgi:hypothetical protein